MKPTPLVLATSLTLTACGSFVATPTRSKTQVVQEMDSGTWPGITLIEARPTPASPAPMASAPSAPTQAARAPAVLAPAAPAPSASAPPVAAVPARSAPAPTASPATPGGVPKAAAVAPTASAPAPDEGLLARLRRLFPPSGESLADAKRLDQPSVGIVLPTASSVTPAASDPATKAPQTTKP